MKTVTFILFLIISWQTSACSCFSEEKSLDEELQKYDAIFEATAIETEKILKNRETSFYKTKMKARQIWKGQAEHGFIFIKTSIESNSCGGPPPTAGNRYLVFAHLSREGLYSTGGCSTFVDLDQVNIYIERASDEEKIELKLIWDEIWRALGNPISVHK